MKLRNLLFTLGLLLYATVAHAALSVSSVSIGTDGRSGTINVANIVTPPLSPSTGVTGFTFTDVTQSLVITVVLDAASTNTVTVTLPYIVNSGDVVTLAYAPGNLVDAASTTMAAFSGTAVTNNSTQVAPSLSTIATGSFASLPAIKAWWKATSGVYQDTAETTPATTDGQTVAAWHDQTGNGNDLKQSSSGARPALKLAANGIGGLATLKATGGQSMTLASLMGANDGQSFSVYVVSSQPASAASGFALSFNTNGLGWYEGAPASLSNTATQLPPQAGLYGTYGALIYGTTASSYFDNDSYTTVKSFVFDGTNLTWGANGNFKQATQSAAFSLAGGLGVFSRSSGDFNFTGNISEVVVCNAAHSPALREAVEQALETEYSVPSAKEFIAVGDSITNGFNGTQYTTQLAALLPAGSWYLQNNGVNGTTIEQMIARYAGQVIPYWSSRPRNVVAFWGGTNNWNDSSSAANGTAEYAKWVTGAQILESEGFRVIGCTVLPGYSTSGGFNAARQQFNSLMRAGWQSIPIDGIADVGADSTMGQNGQNISNTTAYNADQLHPKTAGDTIITGYVQSALLGTAYAQNVTQTGIDNGLFAGALTKPSSLHSSSNVFTFGAATGGVSTYTAQLQRSPNVVNSDGTVNYNCPGTPANVSGATSTTNGATLTDTSTLASGEYWWRVQVTDSTGGTPLVNYSNWVTGIVSSSFRTISANRRQYRLAQ